MRCWLLASVFFVGCGSVNSVPDGATGDGNGSSADASIDAPTCGGPGESCCASNSCDTGLSCTTGDQICRSALIFAGGQDGANSLAIVARGSGTSFTIDNLGTGNVVAVWGSSASDVWAMYTSPIGAGQQTFLRRWNGSAWEAVITLSGYYYGLWGNAQNNYWAVNNNGQAIHFDGVSWSTPMPISSGIVFVQVWGASANDVWALGGSTVGHWTGSWGSTTRSDFAVQTRGAISGRTGSGEVFAGGVSNSAPAVLHRNGANFTVEPVPGCGDARAVWAGPADAWALTGPIIANGSCTLQPTVAHLENGTWADKGKLPGAASGQALWGTSSRDLFAAGQSGTNAGLFHYNGTSWTPAFTPTSGATHFYAVWGTGAN
jgi:hypothetical protein